MLTPTFHFSILKDFLEVFNEKALDLVEVMQRDHCDTDREFDISTLVTLSTLDIICSELSFLHQIARVVHHYHTIVQFP